MDNVNGFFMAALWACSYAQSWQQLQDRSTWLELKQLAEGWIIALSTQRRMVLVLRARPFAPMPSRSLSPRCSYDGRAGCTTRQNQSMPEAQIQNLPPDGSLDDVNVS
jgi:hypothetical protein